MSTIFYGALLLLLLLSQQAAAPIDPAKDIAASDPTRRLAAARALVEGGKEDAEKPLLKALGDEVWEVAAVAAEGLGKLAAKKALAPLIDLALEGPVRGLRRAAAEALAHIDAHAAYEKLAKVLGDDGTVRACEALVRLGPAFEGKLKTTALEKLLKEREPGPRRAAACALVALAGDGRAARLKEFLADPDVALRAFVIETAGASRDPAVLAPLMSLFEQPALPDFLARRAAAALRALCLAHPESARELEAAVARLAATPAARANLARLVGALAEERQDAHALEPAAALRLLEPLLGDPDAKTRAPAVAACERIGGDEALERVAKLAASDADARVRRVALGILARRRGAKHEETLALLVDRLAHDTDARTREVAAVALGVRNLPAATAALEAALADPDWRVVTSAAVSLGMTENEASAAALLALHARGANDWRTRATAVVGLTRLHAKAGVPLLISALEDPEALIARTAYEYLAGIAHERLEPKVALWNKWWEQNQEKIRLSLPEEVLERRKKLEYAHEHSQSELFQGTYAGIDVLVLQSRGDHIEKVFDALKIVHRRTSSGQVIAAGLHPQGVFVSNCTGEITKDEASRLAWFVHAGGALFGSCWALHETIQDLEPGLVRKLETRGEVVADAPAYACDPANRYLEGTFGPDVRPLYHLEGAHLIEVLDPEEVEVLVDSPQCAQAYGGADLAAWFALGHGVVLDSANHFEDQGFQSASLNDPEARMAYAVDHLGLSYEELRALRKEKFWAKTASAAENVRDLSVFRLITNFVWQKRLAEE